MSGADYRQQQELEEEEEWLELKGLDVGKFISGQQFAKLGCTLQPRSSESFKRGYLAQKGLEDILNER